MTVPENSIGVSARLAALVTDPIDRTFFEEDGWWADLILEQFAFLEEYGMDVRVSFYFKEHTIQYVGPHYYVTFIYARQRLCLGWLGQLGSGEAKHLDDLAAERTGRKPAAMKPKGGESIELKIGGWAAGLRELTPSLLGSEP